MSYMPQSIHSCSSALKSALEAFPFHPMWPTNGSSGYNKYTWKRIQVHIPGPFFSGYNHQQMEISLRYKEAERTHVMTEY